MAFLLLLCCMIGRDRRARRDVNIRIARRTVPTVG